MGIDTDPDTTDETEPNSSHYTELREIYVALIRRHEDIKGNRPNRAGEIMYALGMIKALLNEWDASEDRDSHPAGRDD